MGNLTGFIVTFTIGFNCRYSVANMPSNKRKPELCTLLNDVAPNSSIVRTSSCLKVSFLYQMTVELYVN